MKKAWEMHNQRHIIWMAWSCDVIVEHVLICYSRKLWKTVDLRSEEFDPWTEVSGLLALMRFKELSGSVKDRNESSRTTTDLKLWYHTWLLSHLNLWVVTKCNINAKWWLWLYKWMVAVVFINLTTRLCHLRFVTISLYRRDCSLESSIVY